MDLADLNRRTGDVIAAAMAVHSAMGPGLLESAYLACLGYELRSRGVEVRAQIPVPVIYRGISLDAGYRIDLLVDDVLVVEVKAVAKILPIHEAQVLSYLKLSGRPAGLLINFHVLHLRNGIRRLLNGS